MPAFSRRNHCPLAGLLAGLLLLAPQAGAQSTSGSVPGNTPTTAGPPDGVASPAVEATAPLAGGRSVLSSKGSTVIEPSLQYVHTSATQVAIDGFAIIPAIAVGLINVGEVQRDSVTAALTLRHGLTSRLEVELKVPWIWRQEQIRQREVLQGSEFDVLDDASGQGLGDVEVGLRYQFNRGLNGPVVVGNLRVKSTTGTGPFDVSRKPLLTDEGAQVGEVFLEQPTGSGFWSVQPSITLIVPTDPAVLYATLNYLWNIAQDVGGSVGRVNPGNAIGASLGMGLSLNDRTAFSLGYDHSVVGRTRRENDNGLDPAFKRINVGSLGFGISHRLDARKTLNIGFGIGATAAAADIQVSLRLPIRL